MAENREGQKQQKLKWTEKKHEWLTWAQMTWRACLGREDTACCFIWDCVVSVTNASIVLRHFKLCTLLITHRNIKDCIPQICKGVVSGVPSAPRNKLVFYVFVVYFRIISCLYMVFLWIRIWTISNILLIFSLVNELKKHFDIFLLICRKGMIILFFLIIF